MLANCQREPKVEDMGYSARVWEQRRGIGALLRVVASSARRSLTPVAEPVALTSPGPVFRQRVVAPSAVLTKAFIRFCHGDPQTYRGIVPPHLFPQWSLPVMLEAARSLPYPAWQVINVGCSLTQLRPLRAGSPLEVEAQVQSVIAKGRSLELSLSVQSRTAGEPLALDASLQVRVPNPTPPSLTERSRRAPIHVPHDARELSYQRLGPRAGLHFAQLTGDFNPIHWSPSLARLMGFKGAILHGFGSFARCFEALNQTVVARDPGRIRSLSARFGKPLHLPAQVGVYTSGGELFLGDAPDGAAYLSGSYEIAPPSKQPAPYPAPQEITWTRFSS